MSQRFFVETPIEGPHAVLVGPQAHHLVHVMRARPGTEVVLFDGGGAEFPAEVTSLGRSQVELSVAPPIWVDRELPVVVNMGVALPKAQRRTWLVEKLVEMGVARLVPLITRRTEDAFRAATRGRLRRTVIEASKQCGRNRLMEIDEATPFAEHLASAGEDALRLIAHPGSRDDFDPGSTATHQRPNGIGSDGSEQRDVFVAIGPEGGFTSDEIAEARQAGWRTIDLGSRILRTETAAVALAAAIMLQLQRQSAPTSMQVTPD